MAGFLTKVVGVYSSRIHAARFLLELNKKGPLKDRFGLGGRSLEQLKLDYLRHNISW